MITHIAMLRFKEGVEPAAVEAATAALLELPDLVPSIRSFSVGRDLGLTDATLDYAIVARFDDIAGYQAYADHPDHVRVLTEHTRPLTAEVMRVQFED